MENPHETPGGREGAEPSTVNLPDDDERAGAGEVSRDEDTSGGPLSSGAGEGSGHGARDAPDVDVPGGADEGV